MPRISKEYIALTWPEFKEANSTEIYKLLGIYHPTTDDSWVDREQDETAERTLREAQKA